jgi:formate dehydrogenase subunit gamma
MSVSETAPAEAAWNDEAARAIVRARRELPGALLPVLHALQDRFGFIPAQAVALVAEELNLSRADVHGVISFYHYFRQAPPGRHQVALCRAEACQAMGAEALVERAKQRLGIELHGTSDDGHVSLDPVYCLGNCALAPAAMIDGRVHGRLDAQRLDALLGALGEGESEDETR